MGGFNKLFGFIIGISICLSAYSQTTKKVLIEEITGAWCGLCPQGFVFMDSLMMNFENTIGVAIHQGDPMATTGGTEIGDEYTGGGVPAFLIDRFLFEDYGFMSIGTDYNLLIEKTHERLSEEAKVGVSIVNAEIANNKINVTVQADFFEDVEQSDIRFNLYIVESEVVSSESGYGQANFFNYVDDHPFSGAGGVINDFPHKYVCRKMAGGAWGQNNSLPNISYKRGDKFNYIFSVDIEPEWDLDKISLIGLVQCFNESEYEREILNSEEISLQTALNIGTSNTPIDKNQSYVSIYPNPIYQQAKIEFYLKETGETKIFISDNSGATIKVLRNEMLNMGMHSLNWNAVDSNFNALSSGMYFLNIINNNQLTTQKIQLVR